MATPAAHILHEQLAERRARLEIAIAGGKSDPGLQRLLEQVDGALARFEAHEYGRCLICHEDVEAPDLLRNPLLEYCLCRLTPAEQRALEADLTLARRIQGGLLPEPRLRAPGWEAAYSYVPAGMVSGDFCDLWQRSGELSTIYFAVGDVSGKGIAASLLMAHLQAAFRSRFEDGMPLGDLVGGVNRQLMKASLPGHFATLACGRAGQGGEIDLVNAGHCPPLLHGSRGVEALQPTEIPIGVLPDRPYTVQSLRLQQGDMLLLYTDGLTEARRADDAEYGQERLERLLSASGQDTPPELLVQSVTRDLDEFLGGAPRADDITVMALRRAA